MPNARSTARARSATNGRAKAATPRAKGPADVLDPEELLSVLAAVRRGDFSVRMPSTLTGVAGKVADTLNEIIELNQGMAQELERVGKTVGKEGRITQRASLQGAAGSW